LLLADEVERRDQQALERHLQQAGFEDHVTLDGFDWTSTVQLDRRQLQLVFTLEFLARLLQPGHRPLSSGKWLARSELPLTSVSAPSSGV
jgi:hypothetical protein